MAETAAVSRLRPAWLTWRIVLLGALGLACWLALLATAGLGDMRANVVPFEVFFFAGFAAYLAACALALRAERSESRAELILIAAFAVLFRLSLLPTRPSLSDDMFRYVWDGRVQAAGLSPYQYPPGARQVVDLTRNDADIWPYINRKESVTVYPPGAQMTFAALWRILGDSLTGFKAAFAAADWLGGLILLGVLAHFKQPPERVLIYWWSPLLVYEVAQAGHVDGLMLPLLLAALLARLRGRAGWTGLWLGLAVLVKLFPLLLIPALLPPLFKPGARRPDLGPAIRMLAAMAAVIALGYAVYVFRPAGNTGAAGFLPTYFNENFNMGLARPIYDMAKALGWPPAAASNAVTFGGLLVIGLACLARPAVDGRGVLLRLLWLIGWYSLFTQNLFSWYMLWILPPLVVLLEPGRFGFRLNAALAWLVFSGTVMLSYLFFIHWRVIAAAQWAEYLPLYGLLIAAGAAGLKLKGERHAFR